MEGKQYVIEGIAVVIDRDGIVRINRLSRENEATEETVLEGILQDPLRSSHYGRLDYHPPLKSEENPKRQDYVRFTFRQRPTEEAIRSKSTMRDVGLNAIGDTFGYVEKHRDGLTGKQKDTIKRAVHAYDSQS